MSTPTPVTASIGSTTGTGGLPPVVPPPPVSEPSSSRLLREVVFALRDEICELFCPPLPKVHGTEPERLAELDLAEIVQAPPWLAIEEIKREALRLEPGVPLRIEVSLDGLETLDGRLAEAAVLTACAALLTVDARRPEPVISTAPRVTPEQAIMVGRAIAPILPLERNAAPPSIWWIYDALEAHPNWPGGPMAAMAA